MTNDLQNFKKKKDFLVCVDSDGCAIDSMNIKHFNCFGPRLIDEWNLYNWQEAILKRWNVINLFSMTRGINRFKGLIMSLKEINEKYVQIEDLDTLENWVNNTKELSNNQIYIKKGQEIEGQYCYNWELLSSVIKNEIEQKGEIFGNSIYRK